jgi:ABC-type polysaccharide/polyol phosphate export permease
VHCIVFTYFIATAKWIQHAVTVKQLDPELMAPTRSFKAQAFPAALSAMAIVCLTAFVGAATFSYALRPIYHHVMALLCLALNLVVAAIEYRAIARNAALIDRILATINPATV